MEHRPLLFVAKYTRKGADPPLERIKNVAALHDLASYGRCSLTCVIPVLSCMEVKVCPIPTAVLSTQTDGFENFTFRDLTQDVYPIFSHWSSLGISMDCIYSGFLGSFEQISIVRSIFEHSPGALRVVDPVMGDDGALYATMSDEMGYRMRELCSMADVITPNLTEASLLLGEDYASCPGDEAGLRAWLERLSLDGQRSVVLTGVSLHPGVTGAGCFDRETGRISFAMARQEPARFSGTGDLFASVLLGSLLRGEGLADASQRAADFVQHCVAYTLAVGTPLPEGVQFEPLLGELMGPAPSRTDVR